MLKTIILASFAIFSSLTANASTVYTQTTEAGAAALFPGTSAITFNSVPAGDYSTYTSKGVTFTSDTGVMHIDGVYADQFNTFGQSLHNCYCGDSFGKLTFTFAAPVSGFGFFWGASDSQWTLSAYNSSASLLESFVLPITSQSNAGDFVGLRDSGIAYATLTGSSGDYVFIDDFTGLSTVPLPASAPMFGTALLALGIAGYSMKRKAKVTA